MPASDRQLIAMALGVIFGRVHSLSRADRIDLAELVRGLAEATGDEDVDSIRLAMLEILTNAPVRSLPMAFPPEDESPGSDASKIARHIGQAVRRLREEAELSQVDLAGRSGLTQSHVSRIETGTHCPNHKTMQRIADALGVQVRDIDPGG